MWIVTKDGFVSAVVHQDDPDLVRVRARKREHLERLVTPDNEIIDYEGLSDYRWHLDVPRYRFRSWLVDHVMEMTYSTSVKDNVSRDDEEFHTALMRCWSALAKMQTPAPYSAWSYDDEPDYVDMGEFPEL